MISKQPILDNRLKAEPRAKFKGAKPSPNQPGNASLPSDKVQLGVYHQSQPDEAICLGVGVYTGAASLVLRSSTPFGLFGPIAGVTVGASNFRHARRNNQNLEQLKSAGSTHVTVGIPRHGERPVSIEACQEVNERISANGLRSIIIRC